MVFTIVNKKIEVLQTWNYLRHITPGISENARNKSEHLKDIKLEIFNSIETLFFDPQKLDISFMP